MKKINAFFWVKIAIALTLAIGIPAIGIAEEIYMRGAFDGVAARKSATKSAIVTSGSWPTADMTGISQS